MADLSNLNPVAEHYDDMGSLMEISAIETRTGMRLAPAHAELVAAFDGAIAFEQGVCFRSEAMVPFFGEPGALPVEVLFGRQGGRLGLLETFETYTSRIGEAYAPIAEPGGGNLIVYHQSSGEVFFWNHENPAGEADPSAFTRIADTVDAFLSGLEVDDDDYVDPDGTTDGLVSVDLDF